MGVPAMGVAATGEAAAPNAFDAWIAPVADPSEMWGAIQIATVARSATRTNTSFAEASFDLHC